MREEAFIRISKARMATRASLAEEEHGMKGVCLFVVKDFMFGCVIVVAVGLEEGVTVAMVVVMMMMARISYY